MMPVAEVARWRVWCESGTWPRGSWTATSVFPWTRKGREPSPPARAASAEVTPPTRTPRRSVDGSGGLLGFRKPLIVQLKNGRNQSSGI